MKQLALVSLLGSILALVVSACHFAGPGVQGSGVRKSEKRELPAFKSIESEGAYQVAVNCQKPQSFEIEGDDNILPLINTEVRDGVLYVKSPKPYHSSKPVSLAIALPDLESIRSNGAGQFQITDLKNENFEIHSSGAASFTAAGQTKSVKIESSGVGRIDTNNLRAETAEVTVSGAATVDVYGSERLDVNVSGVGRVTYSGNPKTVNKNVSGVGSVSQKESQ